MNEIYFHRFWLKIFYEYLYFEKKYLRQKETKLLYSILWKYTV